MITITDFKIIDQGVQDAVKDAFDHAYKRSRTDPYVLFLANGEYHPEFIGSNNNLNPYTVDNMGDIYKDETRFSFLIEFMKTYYSFPKSVTEIEDNEYRTSVELMVYTHVWESKPFLKQLFKLSQLCSGNGYEWDVKVPEMSKHEFIRDTIRDTFKGEKLQLSDVITDGFHTSLRNAFAHSEYSIDETNKRIVLYTFKGDTRWDIPEISFDDWSKRFAYSALLAYHFEREKLERRKNINKELGTNKHLIMHPRIIMHKGSTSSSIARNIIYDEERDSFYFDRN